MSGSSSARPARLQRFGETAVAMDEGLRIRIGLLDDALAEYRATCEPAYRFVPTATAPEPLRDWSTSIAELGRWTKAVGDAFEDSQDGGEDTVTVDTSDLAAIVDDDYEDPFLGVPEGGWQLDEDRSIELEDPDALSDLLGDLSEGSTQLGALLTGSEHYLRNLSRTATITVRVTATEVLLLSDGSILTRFSRTEASLRLRLPGRVPTGLQNATKWVGGIGAVLSFASSAYDQWQADAELGTGDRVLRSATRGGLVALGGVGGAFLGGLGAGALTGTVCGPGAPVCSGVLGAGSALFGGLAVAFFGDKAADLLPWMNDPEPKPGEYDLDALADEIAQEDSTLSTDLSGARVEIYSLARELALAETADDPDVHAEVQTLLEPPDLSELLNPDRFLGEESTLFPPSTTETDPPMGPYRPGQVPQVTP